MTSVEYAKFRAAPGCGWMTGTAQSGPRVCDQTPKFTTGHPSVVNGRVCGTHARKVIHDGEALTAIPAVPAVPGHALRRNGYGHDPAGRYVGRAGGRAACGCGVMSGWLDSTAARKWWHRDHRAEVLAASGVPTAVAATSPI